MSHDFDEKTFEERQEHIVQLMSQHGVAKITAEYWGVSDNTDGVWVLCYDENDDEVIVDEIDDEDVTQLLWDCLEDAGHDNWEMQEGGGGTLTICKDGNIQLEHYANKIDSNEVEYRELYQDGNDPNWGRAIKAIAQSMANHNLKTIELFYDGAEGKGQAVAVCYFDNDNAAHATHAIKQTDVVAPEAVFHTDEHGREAITTVNKPMGVNAAIEELLWDAMRRSDNAGWAGDKGGTGALKITSTAEVVLTHSSRFNDPEVSSCAWRAKAPDMKSIPRPSA